MAVSFTPALVNTCRKARPDVPFCIVLASFTSSSHGMEQQTAGGSTVRMVEPQFVYAMNGLKIPIASPHNSAEPVMDAGH